MNKIILLLLLLCSLLQAERYAVLVGNNRGGSGFAKLKYVQADLKLMKSVLNENCQFPKENITTLSNGSPEKLLFTLDSIQKVISDQDMLFFYYTGHADSRSLRMGSSRLTLTELKDALDSIPSQMQMLVLDACQSGSFSRLKGGTIEEPLILKQKEDNSGRVVLYSSSETEFSQESDYLKHSIFSFYFMNGLKGMADHSGDKQVTVDEAYRYAYRQTVAATVHSAGGIQHPGYLFNYAGKGNITLADMRSKSTGIILDSRIEGQIAIIDPTRQIVADFVSGQKADLFVSLDPGRYTIYRNNNGKASRAKVHIQGEPNYVSSSSFEEIRSIPLAKKGESEKPLFSLNLAGGVLFQDHSSLSRSMNSNELIDYSGIIYETSLPSASVRVSGGASLLFPKGVLLSTTVAHSRFSGEGIQNSTVSGPENDQYPSTLEHKDELTVTEFEIITGYRFTKTFLKNLSLYLGSSFTGNRFTSEILFSEKLYETENSITIEEKSRKLVPLAGIGYSITPSSVFEISTRALYGGSGLAFQDEGLEFDNSGWRIDLGFSFHLNGR